LIGVSYLVVNTWRLDKWTNFDSRRIIVVLTCQETRTTYIKVVGELGLLKYIKNCFLVDKPSVSDLCIILTQYDKIVTRPMVIMSNELSMWLKDYVSIRPGWLSNFYLCKLDYNLYNDYLIYASLHIFKWLIKITVIWWKILSLILFISAMDLSHLRNTTTIFYICVFMYNSDDNNNAYINLHLCTFLLIRH